jgi:hypothetical protein
MPEPTAKKTAAKKTAATRPAPSELAPPEVWERLVEPFPTDQIEKLPKVLRRDDQDKGRCQEGSRYSADGHYCGGWHSRAVHLDYVGHAGITMRLNSVLGPGGWDFKPYANGPDGLPVMGREFYAALTIRVGEESVTKWDMAANFNGPQEALGDALRRCAMRFGVGTYLWSKSDAALAMAKVAEPEPEAQRPGDRDAGDYPESAPLQVPPHVQATYDLIAGMTEEEKARMAPWWDNAAAAGQLPTRENMAALTPDQAAWVDQTVRAARTPQEAPDPQ